MKVFSLSFNIAIAVLKGVHIVLTSGTSLLVTSFIIALLVILVVTVLVLLFVGIFFTLLLLAGVSLAWSVLNENVVFRGTAFPKKIKVLTKNILSRTFSSCHFYLLNSFWYFWCRTFSTAHFNLVSHVG